MYGRAPTASVASVDAYQSSGLDFERNLTAQESSHGGPFSGIATQCDNPSTEVVLSASDTASSVSRQITLGTVRLNVVGSGVVLLEGEIANIVVQDSSGSNSELQYQPVVAGRGYMIIGTSSLGARMLSSAGPLIPARQLAARWQEVAARRLQWTCDPCSARVWGDFNGDCQFLTSDVLALSEFVLARAPFEDGSSTTDPLLTYVGGGEDSCDFIKLQANLSSDLMYQAGTDALDARFGRPVVTAFYSLHLLYATVKKHRFLFSLQATCEDSSVAGRATVKMSSPWMPIRRLRTCLWRYTSRRRRRPPRSTSHRVVRQWRGSRLAVSSALVLVVGL